MLNGFLSTNHISFILVFLEGLLSFFSPCVIPLIPVYMGFLAGNAKQIDKDGAIIYGRKKVFFHTVFFIFGISFAFFILGMSFTAIGTFFKSNQLLFTRIGGILIILLGLSQIGLLDFKFLQKERKIHLDYGNRKMNPLIAFFMGFTFSFAWTPCVGPALSSVLILASGAGSSLIGDLLVLVYTIGFIIPFLLLGLFTTQVLNFLKGSQKLLRYTIKTGGFILILIGIMTFTGWMNGISGYLNRFTASPSSDASEKNFEAAEESTDPSPTGAPDTNKKDIIPAFDFTLTDQYGNEHTLSDYKGKVVFLNFWATWCPPCKKEMPDIEELYQEYDQNKGDVIILGVANPSSVEHPNNQDVTKKEVTSFLEDNNYSFPVVFDETGDVLNSYSISSFPTTFLIDKEGNIYGYAPGMLTKDMMKNIIHKALDSTLK